MGGGGLPTCTANCTADANRLERRKDGCPGCQFGGALVERATAGRPSNRLYALRRPRFAFLVGAALASPAAGTAPVPRW